MAQLYGIHSYFTNTVRRTEMIALDDLLKPEKLDLLREAFTQPEAFRSHETTAQVSSDRRADSGVAAGAEPGAGRCPRSTDYHAMTA